MDIDTYCGLTCTDCEYREKMHCGGCIATKGNPFHGHCRVAACANEKGVPCCAACDELPCALLTSFSYDKEQGDDGARIQRCFEQREALKNA